MDDIVDELVDIGRAINFEQLPESVIAAATLRLVDTLGCAVGGAQCPAASIGRRLAPRLDHGEPASARALGSARRQTSVEAAGFVNSTMIRYLDFNDSYPGSHPSDALGPILALADATHRSGKDVVTALVAAYEVLIRCAKATRLRELGWDQGFVIGLGVAAGTSVLMGLDEERTRHALSIVAVSTVPLRATRAGQLSMWKGAATAYAARNAFFATMLAADGMTSPDAPIQGRHGLQDLITGPISLSPFTGDEDSFLIRQVRTKYWPVESHVQGVVWAAIELREQVSIDEVEEVELAVGQLAWHETASEADKWDPRSRETADHSMPYIFVRAMQAGGLNLSAYEPAAYLDDAARPLMQKVRVVVDDDIESRYPGEIIVRATAKPPAGQINTVEVRNTRGHKDNPVSPEEIDAKFLRLASPTLGEKRSQEALDFWNKVTEHDDIGTGLDLLVIADLDKAQPPSSSECPNEWSPTR